MGEHCHQPHEPGAFIDSRCLDGGDLMPAEAFAHEVEPARQRRIAKAPTPFGVMPGSVPTSDFAGLVSSSCAFARAAAMVPMFSLERCMGALHRHEREADCTGFRPLCSDAMTDGFLGVLRHQRLE